MKKMLQQIFATLTEKCISRELTEDALAGLSAEEGPDEATAYAVLLTELGRSDGDFTSEERAIITGALERLFPKAHLDAAQLIKNAEGVLDSFRGSGMYIAKIKEEYSPEERRRLFEAISATIQADGTTSAAEHFLEQKLSRIL